MVKSFLIDLFDGHLIFENDGLKVLVDTGCPATIGKSTHFDFMGQSYQCMTEFGGKGIAEISAMMGYDIDVFILNMFVPLIPIFVESARRIKTVQIIK